MSVLEEKEGTICFDILAEQSTKGEFTQENLQMLPEAKFNMVH